MEVKLSSSGPGPGSKFNSSRGDFKQDFKELVVKPRSGSGPSRSGLSNNYLTSVDLKLDE